MENIDINKVDSVAVKLLNNIVCKEWGLSQPHANALLNGGYVNEDLSFAKDVCLTQEQRERISMIVAIYKALNVLFAKPQQANTWICRPNTVFDGLSALDVMLKPEQNGLEVIQRYLLSLTE